VKSCRKTPPEIESPRGEDTTVNPTVGGHLDAHPAAPKKPRGSPKPTAKGSGNVSVPAAPMEAARRCTSTDLPRKVSRPLSDAPVGTTSTVQVEKEVSPPEERRDEIKPRCTCLA
jgi:hypothetical protein